MISQPYQLTEEDVGYNGVESKDIGKWVVMVNSTLQGFSCAREELADLESHDDITDWDAWMKTND